MNEDDARKMPFVFLLFPTSAVFAGAFLYYESLVTKPIVPWFGWDLVDYAPYLPGFLIYVAVILATAFCIALPIGMLARAKRPGPRRAVLIVGVVSIFFWIVLGTISSGVSTRHVAYGSFGIVAVSVILLIQLVVFEQSRRAILLHWAAVWLGAIGTLQAMAATSPAQNPLSPGRSLGHIELQSLGAATSVCVFCLVSHWLIARSLRGRVAWFLLCVGAAVVPPLIVYGASSSASPAGEGSGPNFLIISADTLRADYLSVYGGTTPTPALERLSQNGVVFWNHYSLAPWTIPSLNGTFSSTYPPSMTVDAVSKEDLQAQFEMYANLGEYWTGPSQTTLLDLLRDRGYRSAAYMSNGGMKWQRWLWTHFDEVTIVGMPLEYLRESLERLPILQASLNRITRKSDASENPNQQPLGRMVRASNHLAAYNYTREVERYTRAFLRHRSARPFFLWVHFMDPHSPLAPPDEYAPRERPFAYYPVTPSGAMEHEHGFIRDLYRGEIRYVDAAVGRILDELDRQGLAENTYVLFFSDHGEELWDRHRIGHGHTLHQEVVRIPLILAGPGLAARRVDASVSSIDIVPTLADLADISALANWRGKSLLPLLEPGNVEYEPSPVFIQATGFFTEPLQAVVWENYKLIRGMRSGKRYLYDLSSDPGELRNLAAAQPLIADRLAERLSIWSKTFPVTLDDVKEYLDSDVDPELRKQQIEALEALGYLK